MKKIHRETLNISSYTDANGVEVPFNVFRLEIMAYMVVTILDLRTYSASTSGILSLQRQTDYNKMRSLDHFQVECLHSFVIYTGIPVL
jgi:hypothetical protein